MIRISPLHWAVLATCTVFFGIALFAIGAAYSRKSGNTGIDTARIPQMRQTALRQQLPLKISSREATPKALFFVALLRQPHGRGCLYRATKNPVLRRISREEIF